MPVDKNLNEYYQKSYTQLASSYDETRFGGAKREFSKNSKNDVILSYLDSYKISKDTPITDIASGTGRIVHCLLRNGYRKITSVDLTQAMLDQNEKNVPEGTRQFVQYHCADMKKLPLPDNSADVITIGKFFYLIPKDEYDNYMQDVKRVLKKDGILICEVSNAFHLFNPFSFLKTWFRKSILGKKIKSYVYPWDFKKIFTGLKFEQATGIEFPFPIVKKMSALRRMNAIPFLRKLGGGFVLVYRLAK